MIKLTIAYHLLRPVFRGKAGWAVCGLQAFCEGLQVMLGSDKGEAGGTTPAAALELVDVAWFVLNCVPVSSKGHSMRMQTLPLLCTLSTLKGRIRLRSVPLSSAGAPNLSR